MANKSTKSKCPALGAKMAAPAAIMVATSKAMSKTEDAALTSEIARLQAELDAERRTIRQLRRDQETEILKVRNEEQTKASIALKDQAKRNLEERQRDIELQRESLRGKVDSDWGKVVKLKDREITKLRGDLDKCQNELREELSKRGLSSAARATFDSERQKLLQEVRDLQIAKRHLEDRLEKAGETEKRLQLEMRRVQETCKLEVTRVEREANLEVKKLLEELKNKDHMLEMMDRAIHPDRSTLLKNRLDKLTVEDMLNMAPCRDGVDSYNKFRSYNNSYSLKSHKINTENGGEVECKCERMRSTDYTQCKCTNSNSECQNDNQDGNQTFIDSINVDCKNCRCVCVSNHSAMGGRNLHRKAAITTGRSASVGTRTHRDTSKVRSSSTGSVGRNKEVIARSSRSLNKNSVSRSNGSKKLKVNVSRSKSNDKSKPNITGSMDKVQNQISSQHVSHKENIEESKTNQTNIKSLDQCVNNETSDLQTTYLKRLEEREKRVRMNETLHRAVVEKNNKLSADNKYLENKIKDLYQQIKNLKNQQASSRKEIKKLNDIIAKNEASDLDTGSRSEDGYKQRCSELEQVLTSLRHDCQEKDRRIGLLIKSQQKYRHKYEPKTVRFLLPDDHQDDDISLTTEDSKSSTTSSCSDPIECDEVLLQSVHKDYETLLVEHMKLQRYCASLLQAKPNTVTAAALASTTIQVMEEKLQAAEQREHRLKKQLLELTDQNEEMEFRILELEEFSEKNLSLSCTEGDVEDIIKFRHLEDEVNSLRCRLAQYECQDLQQFEQDAICSGMPVSQTNLSGPQRLSVENLRKLRESLSDSDDENPMVESFSTMTSGFDEISSMSLDLEDRTEMPDMSPEEADLERDADDIPPEMPSEEVIDEDCSGKRLEEMSYSGLGQSNNVDYGKEVAGVTEVLSEDFSRAILSPLIIPSANELNTTNVSIDEESLNDLLESHKSIAGCEINEAPNIPSLAEVSQNIENKPESGKLDESDKVQRIQELQNEVELLQNFDYKYSATIQSLNDLESRLNRILPVTTQQPDQSRAVPSGNVGIIDSTMKSCEGNFWTDAKQEMENKMTAVQQEINGLNAVDCEESTCDEEIEYYTMLNQCVSTLNNTNTILQCEREACQQLDCRIVELERRSEKHGSIVEECYQRLDDLPVESAPVFQPNEDNKEAVDAGIFGSLKRMALDAVAAGFRTDILELKSLTHDFFAATVDDELNDIVFIDEDESACVQVNASTEAEIETRSTRLSERNELRLNTKISSLNQRFDFLSPTSFDNPDWSGSSHLETVNHCLLQQMEELERERDSLKDIVYRDDGVINEMTQQISLLQNSEQELKNMVCRLEATEDQSREQISRYELHCQSLQCKLARAESVEATLRHEIEALGKSELELEARLQKSVDSLEQTAARLRLNLSEAEREKAAAEKQSEELSVVVATLQSKEMLMIKRMKSLENLHENLTEKTSDLETTLASAYDQVTNLTRQKDTLAQKLNFVRDENVYLQKDNEELATERKKLRADLEKLDESENFLKEANRKLWLSLQANIEEREQILSRKCQRCATTEKSGVNVEENKSLTSAVEHKEASVQAGCEPVGSECNTTGPKTHLNQELLDPLTQAVTRLARSCPNTLLFFLAYISQLISRTSVKHGEQTRGAVVTERKAIIEEILKLIGSTRRATTSQPITADLKKEKSGSSLLDEVLDMNGEDELWGVVERYDDISDVRAADTCHLWRQLEIDIMKVNLDDLRAILEEREADKSCQTNEQEILCHVATSNESLTQCDVKPGEKRRNVVEMPPLPTSKPPVEDDDEDDIVNCIEQCTQTDTVAPHSDTFSEVYVEINNLRHLLNVNERTLSAQKKEVDRLTLELRSWQQRALQADNEKSCLATEISSAQLAEARGRNFSDLKSLSGNTENKQDTDQIRSRIEPQSSQIPVSVRRAVELYTAIGQGAGPVCPSSAHILPIKTSAIPKLSPRRSRPISLTTEAAVARLEEQLATTTQGPASNGSSISDNQEQLFQPSQIPRLLPEWIQQQQQIRQQGSDGGHADVLDEATHQSGSMKTHESLPVLTTKVTTSAQSRAVVESSAVVETLVPPSHKDTRSGEV